MAIGHFAIRLQQRSRGHTATAGVAYRCGLDLRDEGTGRLHRYANREDQQTIAHTGIIYRERRSPVTTATAARFCRYVEDREPRSDAVIGRDFQGALPFELTPEQRVELVECFSSFVSTRYRTPLLYAIHEPHEDHNEQNVHCHIWVPARDENGRKLEALNLRSGGREEIKLLRGAWELCANTALARAGKEPTVHTGKNPHGDPEPTLGADATARERAAREGDHTVIGKSVSEMCSDGRSVTFEAHLLREHRVRKEERAAHDQQRRERARRPQKRRRRVRSQPGARAGPAHARADHRAPTPTRRSASARVGGPDTVRLDDRHIAATAGPRRRRQATTPEEWEAERLAIVIEELLRGPELKRATETPKPRTVVKRSRGRVAARPRRPEAI